MEPLSIKLTVYTGRGGRRPEAVVALLHGAGLAGATVLLGVDGTVRGTRRRARFLAATPRSRRWSSPWATATGSRPSCPRAPAGEDVTLERVHVCKRDGVLLEPPPELAETAGGGLQRWLKLSVFGRAGLEEPLVRALREAGGAGRPRCGGPGASTATTARTATASCPSAATSRCSRSPSTRLRACTSCSRSWTG